MKESNTKENVIKLEKTFNFSTFTKVVAWIILVGGIFGGFYYLSNSVASHGAVKGSGVIFLYMLFGAFILFTLLFSIAKITEHLYVMRRISEARAEADGYNINPEESEKFSDIKPV